MKRSPRSVVIIRSEPAFGGRSSIDTCSEFVDESRKVRVEINDGVLLDIIESPPLGAGELRLVRHKRDIRGGFEHVPETHVGMTLRTALSAGDRDHERFGSDGGVEPGRNPELLQDLSACGVRRVFIDIEVASGRKPTFGISVFDQQDLSSVGIDQHAVRHEVLRRCSWLRRPEDLTWLIEPSECVESILGLGAIVRNDLVDEGADGLSHPSHRSTLRGRL